MATKGNGDKVRELYRAIEQGDMDAIDRMGGDAPMENIAFGQTTTLREDSEINKTAFPDLKIEVKQVVEQGDTVMVEGIGRGTHQGPLRTDEGEIAPTGRRVEVRFVDVYQFSNGKIHAARFYTDRAAIMEQLGAQAPAEAGAPPPPH
jgi:predicted ester cyclase